MANLPPVTRLVVLVLFLFYAAGGGAQEPKPRLPSELAKAGRPAVVVINAAGRTGEQRSTGSGFVVRADGVVATNFHVIGRGRAFTVQMADGKTYAPTHVLAVDRVKDLALVRVDAGDLPVLPLGDSDAVEPGQRVLAIGNPLGLRLSVTDGVISEKRALGDRQMIQVAMTIEPGSSGSPLIDGDGRVVGIIAIKSAASLGFAVPINDLKPLLQEHHPIRIEQWLTIGALDARDWEPLMDGHWRQRAGRIVCTGAGGGFGGRTLCLSHTAPPEGAFELAVDVRLEDESGAAGLVFHSDGADRHYGFYPTAGALRLTRFDGPDVFSWTILQTVPSEHYRPGQWNTIKVRLDGHKISCFVNDEAVIEAEDDGLTSGRIGLVKFREPSAEFRRFQVGKKVASVNLPQEERDAVLALGAKLLNETDREPEALGQLASHGSGALRALRARAQELETQATRLRELAARVHQRRIEEQLRVLFDQDDAEVDLAQAALLVAKLDNEELEIEPYLRMLDLMAGEVRKQFDEQTGPREKLDTLIRHLFEELGFHGSRGEYYHRSNSYLNEVLDDREGLPLTLSMVFLDLARRLELPVVGVGIPRHFLVQYRPFEGEPLLVDVFNDGKMITREEAAALSGQPLQEEHFAPAGKKEMIVRMLRNLGGVAERERDLPAMLRYLDVILVIDESAAAERGMRAAVRYQMGRTDAAAEDLDWLLQREPPGVDLDRVREFRDVIRRQRR
jgi:serine protease Do